MRGPFEVTFRFSRAVTGFTADDIEVGNGSVVDGVLNKVDAATWRATLEPAADFEGTVTVDVGAAVAEDAAGTDNEAAEQLRIAADLAAPTATVTSGAEPPVAAEFAVTVRFSEPTSGFAMSELEIVNGQATLMASLGNGTEHTVYVAPDPDASGELSITVPAGVATDAAGNPNTASAPFTIALPWNPITGFTLFDNAAGRDVRTLSEGTELAVLASDQLNIRAEVRAGTDIGSVRLELSGQETSSRTEGPCPLRAVRRPGRTGLSGRGPTRSAPPPIRSRNLGGTPGRSRSVAFTVLARPTVAGVAITSSPASGAAYADGEAITVTVLLDAPVTVDTTGGTPTIGLTVGGAARAAAYDARGSGLRPAGVRLPGDGR